MTQGSCKLTQDHVAIVRRAILDFRAADDRAYLDKERPLQLADDLMNALLAQLYDVEALVQQTPPEQCMQAPPQRSAPRGVEDRFSDALQAFTDAKVLKLQAEERVAEGELAALQHARNKV